MTLCLLDLVGNYCSIWGPLGFPGGASGKNKPASAQDGRDLIPGSGRSPGGGPSNPLQYSCLENSMDRGTWRAAVPWGHNESDTTEQHAHNWGSLRMFSIHTKLPCAQMPSPWILEQQEATIRLLFFLIKLLFFLKRIEILSFISYS